MKTLLPIAPAPAPSAPPADASLRALDAGVETFASVLDRCQPPTPQSSERQMAKSGEGAVVRETPDEAASDTEEAEGDELLAAPATSVPTLALPLLPYRPIEPLDFAWAPPIDDAPAVAGEEVAAPTIAAPEPIPAHSAAPIFAAPSPDRSISAAATPPRVESSIATPAKRSTPDRKVEGAPIPMARNPIASVAPREGDASLNPPMATAPVFSATPAGTVEEATPNPVASIEWATPVRATPLSPTAHVAPAIETTHGMQPAAPAPRAVSREPMAIEPPIATPVAVAPQVDGTPAAKRGEVMPAVFISVPNQPPATRSAGRSLPSPDIATPVAEDAAPVAPPEDRDVALAMAPRKRRTPLTTDAVMPEAPVTKGAPQPASRAHAVAPRAVAFDPSAPADRGADEADPRPAIAADARIEAHATTPFSTAASPTAERVKAEAAAPAAPIERAEVVRLAERTADAAVRLRATDGERIEVSVQLASGERLTIELQFAGGEVTPRFLTNSEGLRVALEQQWSQFTDRASDRGVRLTPPVFDVSSSSSNMTDLSQQRHGRDSAHTAAQAELFPHLPRRVRPPRVLAAASHEPSPATAGVRAYA